MSKQIRVSDAAYAVLTREAKANHRSILADQVDAMVLDGASRGNTEPTEPRSAAKVATPMKREATNGE